MSIDFQKLQTDVAATKEAVELLLAWVQQNAPTPATSTDEEKPLTLKEAADFLGIAEQTVYQNIKKIPSRKKHGRHYFFKSELAAYLETDGPRLAKRTAATSNPTVSHAL